MSRLVVLTGYGIPTDLELEAAALAGIGATLLDARHASETALDAHLREAVGVLTETLTTFDAERLARMERCRAISVAAAGTDVVDLAAAAVRGIVVTNVPHYCIAEVADHTLALLLAVWRKLRAAEAIARCGSWDLDGLRPVRRLAGRTLGLVGFGAIGRGVAERARAFGMTVVAHDPLVASANVRLCRLDEVLASCDVLCLHVPLTAETAGLIGREELRRLRPGAVLVNASRGAVVDHDALVEALRDGHLAGAGLDVLPSEPPAPDEPLLVMDNVVVTPHMGYYSEESLEDLRRTAVENLVAALSGRHPGSVVEPGSPPDLPV